MRCYLSKSSPRIWKTREYLRGLDIDMPDWWSDVCKDVQPGDTLFIGVSGEEAGIYARATIVSRARPDTPDREFYVNPKDVKERLGADIDGNSFRNLLREGRPILEDRLNAIPQLGRVARWLHVQGGCCRLSLGECEALNALV